MRSGPTILAILMGTTPLAAQQAPAPEAILLDPIVLRAGTERVASSVPQSVTVVDQAALDDLAPGSIGDVLAQVPGVSNTGGAGFFGQGFNIRGFGSSGTAASEAGIVQLIDGERKYFESYRQGSLFVEPDFLKRVEVLRGPGSSTLYGAGALGGVIAMETIDAGDLIAEGRTSGGRVRLGYASNPDTGFGSVAWGWRPTEGFEAVTAFAYRHLGDTKAPDGTTTVRSNSDTPNLLLKARQQMGDHYLEGSYLQMEARGDNQDFNQLEGAQPGLFPGFTGWGVGDILTRDQTTRLVWGYDPANPLIDAKVTLSYSNTIKDVRQGDDPDEPILDSLLGRRDYALWKLRGENVADISGAGYGHFLTVGIEASEQDRSSTTLASSHPEAMTRQAAVYALSELDFGALTVNTGLRYTRQKTEPKDSVTVTDDSLSTNALEPQIAAMYRLTDQWSVFGSAALVKRVPTVDELYDSGTGRIISGASPDLTEETGKNIEIGVSYAGTDLFATGDQAAVKVTLFRNHIDDMIIRTNAPFPNPSYVNVDRAYLRGGEIEASYAGGGWQLGASVSVVQGRDQDGTDLDTLPNNRLMMQASYQATPSLRLGARSTLAAGRDKPEADRRSGYGVHDIFATWAPQSGVVQGTEISLGIDNVTDRDYVPATWLTGPAPGRNVKLTLTRSF
ncbi:TonB-dependent receptor domain-containing protein [Paracoccus nototheniae]|uniref:TonB-dependent receptor domain-containing protein n=1 Tax=Paracoccus nototheniae TaxID=2489002 RepID=A0ABW4DUA7_9RHOB|nr:TonB-dependent receptor [Paracoccus nototheniae]